MSKLTSFISEKYTRKKRPNSDALCDKLHPLDKIDQSINQSIIQSISQSGLFREKTRSVHYILSFCSI